MKRVLTAFVLVPVVLVLVFLGPKWQWLFSLAVAAVAALAGWEYLSLVAQRGTHPPRLIVVLALLVLFVAGAQWPDWMPDWEFKASLFSALCLILLLFCVFFRPLEEALADTSASIFCLFYIGLTLLSLVNLHEQPDGRSLVVFLFCVVWAGDTAAYYVGRAWGRHKLAPALSPGKTWEGAVGSVAGSLLAVWGLLELATQLQAHDFAVLSYPEETWYWLLLAAVVNVAAQAGDLAESGLKRSAGVKDSGSLLPGHGGVLDRIDAVLVAAPVLWYAQVLHRRF